MPYLVLITTFSRKYLPCRHHQPSHVPGRNSSHSEWFDEVQKRLTKWLVRSKKVDGIVDEVYRVDGTRYVHRLDNNTVKVIAADRRYIAHGVSFYNSMFDELQTGINRRNSL